MYRNTRSLVVTVVALLMVCLTSSIWAQEKERRPDKGRPDKIQTAPDKGRVEKRIKPQSVKLIGENGREVPKTATSAKPSAGKNGDEISEPSMWAYAQPGQKGARLGVGASANFPITAMALYVDGRFAGATTASFYPGTIPSLTQENEFEENRGFVTPEILTVGSHIAQLHVYPDYPKSRKYFVGEFEVEVDWFDFWVDACISYANEGGKLAEVTYFIHSIGAIPPEVTVETGVFSGYSRVEVTDLQNGVAKVLLPIEIYADQVGGQTLDTTIAEVVSPDKRRHSRQERFSRTTTLLVWYPELEYLNLCGCQPIGIGEASGSGSGASSGSNSCYKDEKGAASQKK